MLEEYLKIFNDYLEIQDINNAIKYIDKIFIDPKYLKIKNLFLYLLGSIAELPEKYIDYIKTIFNYDLIMPVSEVRISEAKNFLKAILFHDFIKARNIYYEYMDSTREPECRRALLNLLNLASGVKKNDNKIIENLFKEKDYYNLYAYVHNIVLHKPTFCNIYVLDLLLQDYITKDYFSDDSNYKYTTLIDEVKHKQYEQVLEFYQNITYNEKENSEIVVICDVLSNIIAEKKNMMPPEEIKSIEKSLNREMFLDFLGSVEDIIEKEGFAILNPESKEINQEMRDLTYYIPNLAAYEIGGNKKQVVINRRRNYANSINNSIFELKKEAYNKGKSFDYIEYALEHLKYIIPSELDAIKLSQSYFRVGLISEGLNALKLAIGLKEYDNKTIYSNNVLNYYMMQDYFNAKYARILDKSRQNQMIK